MIECYFCTQNERRTRVYADWREKKYSEVNITDKEGALLVSISDSDVISYGEIKVELVEKSDN